MFPQIVKVSFETYEEWGLLSCYLPHFSIVIILWPYDSTHKHNIIEQKHLKIRRFIIAFYFKIPVLFGYMLQIIKRNTHFSFGSFCGNVTQATS